MLRVLLIESPPRSATVGNVERVASMSVEWVEAIGTWVGGIGTVAAVVTALWIALRESRERIRAAILNSAYFFPIHKVTVNLAPADVRKEGASFDLPIALGILGAHGDLGKLENLSDVVSVGQTLKPTVVT